MPSRPRTHLPLPPIPIRSSSSRFLRFLLSGRPTPDSYIVSYMPTSCTSKSLLRGLFSSKLDGIKHLAADAASTTSLQSYCDSDDEWSAEGDEQDWQIFPTPPASLQDHAGVKAELRDDIKVRYAYVRQLDINVWKVSCPIVGHGKMCIVSRKVSGVQQVCGCCGKGPLVRRVRRVARRVDVYVYYVFMKGYGRGEVMGEDKVEIEGKQEEMKCSPNWDGDEDWDWEVLKQEGELSGEQRTERWPPHRSTNETGLLDSSLEAVPTTTTTLHYKYAREKRIDSLAEEGY